MQSIIIAASLLVGAYFSATVIAIASVRFAKRTR